ncbi:hypothetical protein CC80DRAFT_97523 [Byssothecium circinans]|uniref:Uncharacterized protein n=1 Tax=Byssothecium circinans TaxID=147558 RepID=A0A6A5UDK2_9PLEO|nr:hypothetical protein CC80DRAFT_97523 [Byssothecium circinans]
MSCHCYPYQRARDSSGCSNPLASSVNFPLRLHYLRHFHGFTSLRYVCGGEYFSDVYPVSIIDCQTTPRFSAANIGAFFSYEFKCSTKSKYFLQFPSLNTDQAKDPEGSSTSTPKTKHFSQFLRPDADKKRCRRIFSTPQTKSAPRKDLWKNYSGPKVRENE